MTANDPNDFKIAKLFVITVREFFSNTTLHGFKYLVKSGLSSFEKLFWYLIQLCALAGAGYIFLYAFDGFASKPTVTSLESVNHPNSDIDFPAVAVCPVNKISKKAAILWATELSKRTKNYTFDWLFQNVHYLGHTFQFDILDYDKYIIFQNLLDIIDVNNVTQAFDPQDKFEFKISPKCEDLLVRCRWGYKETECMKLFEFRKSRDGYCCLFNYVRQYNVLSKDAVGKKANRTKLIGWNHGLTILLNATTSDYLFSNGDHVGFYVNILTATEYPDYSNGGLTQLIVEANTRTYFKVVPTTVRSKSSIEQYSPKQRGCLFEHELFDQYAGHYNLVDCLQKCKIQKIVNLCKCMPFYMPYNFPDKTGSPIKCTLADNKCLRESRFKMDAYVLENTNFDRELMEESTSCPECLPLCSKTRFRIFSSHFPLTKKGLEEFDTLSLRNLSTLNDISIVHLYYGLPESKLFTADVLMTWQEIVSHFGGLLGLCIGFSLINIVEIVYFSTFRLYQNLKDMNSKQKFLEVQPVRPVQHHSDIKEERKIREMYVNDFRMEGQYSFRRT